MKNREKNINTFEIEALDLLKPETDLEQGFLNCDDFRQGLDWGIPRYGHPEGKVLYHVREVLDNVDKIEGLPGVCREKLRLITFTHDTFKYKEDKTTRPRNWLKHHGMLARKYLEKYFEDEAILDIIELHDEAYYCWRMLHLYDQQEAGQKRLDQLLLKMKDQLQLYYLFFKCDTQTGDKIQSPVKWFEQAIGDIDVVAF